MATEPRTPGASAAAQQQVTDIFRDIHSPVAKVAAEARERLVALGVAAIPGLTNLLDDPAPGARWEAVHALAEIHTPQAAPALVSALSDEDGGVRWIAAEGLVEIGPACLVPLLRELLARSESVWLRDGVHHVLTAFRHQGRLPRSCQHLLAALEGIDPSIGCLEPAFAALTALEATPKG